MFIISKIKLYKDTIFQFKKRFKESKKEIKTTKKILKYLSRNINDIKLKFEKKFGNKYAKTFNLLNRFQKQSEKLVYT